MDDKVKTEPIDIEVAKEELPSNDDVIPRAIVLSLHRFRSLLASGGFDIVQIYAVDNEIRFFELKTYSFRNSFFVRIPERYSMTNSDDELEVAQIYENVLPQYKKLYIDLLGGLIDEVKLTSKAFVNANKDSLSYVSRDHLIFYSFDGAAIASPAKPKPSIDKIRELESAMTSVCENVVKVPDFTFVEQTEIPVDASTFEVYDKDGRMIEDFTTLMHFSPKPVHLSNGKIVEYDSDYNPSFRARTPNASPSVSTNPKVESSVLRDHPAYIDVGELYSCYDINEFFSLSKDPSDFENKIAKDYESYLTLEGTLRERKLEKIDVSLNEYKLRVLRTLEDIREAENELRMQIKRLVALLASSRKAKKIHQSEKSPKGNLEELEAVESRTKMMLDELVLTLITKKDQVNEALSDYSRRIARIFE